jgi:hypothetical protein
MRAIAVLIRAAGWPAIIGLTLCAALVGGCALTFAGAVGTSAPLNAALALLAAAGGFALEEPAAAVVDLTPTRSVQLTAVRAVALLPPLLTGCALALFATHSSGPPALDLSVTLLGSSILGFTLADVARQRVDEPGAVVAVAVILLVVVTPMIGAVARHVHTVPTTDPGAPGLSSNATWAFVMAACLLAIVVTASNDRRYRRRLVHTTAGCRHAWPPELPLTNNSHPREWP